MHPITKTYGTLLMTDLWTAVKDLPIAIESTSFEALLPSGPTALEDFSTTQRLRWLDRAPRTRCSRRWR
jgi:hypothetical protein